MTDRLRARGRPIVDVVAHAMDAGVRFVQIRERDLPDAEVAALIEALLRRAPADAWVTVNGRSALAAEFRIGLHLPAGAHVPDRATIPYWGRSVHDADELARASAEEPAYLILGTLFPTESKPGRPGRGLDWLRGLELARIATPVFAIGGIDPARAAAARAAAAYGVAVCGAIVAADDPARAAAELLRATLVEPG